jgi:hypothetical protein
MKYKVIALGLLLVPSLSNAEALTLSNADQIKRASALSQAIDHVSEKVMTCMNEPGGSQETCACFDLDSCLFKSEFEQAAEIYCGIKLDFPSWAGKSINFQVEGDGQSHAIGMTGLEKQFGQFCR